MGRQKGKKNDGRKSNLTFSWMLDTLGPEWQQWQAFAAEWMSKQNTSISDKQKSLTRFFESYLLICAPYAIDVNLFFKGHNGHHCSTEELQVIVSKTVKSTSELTRSINHSCNFIDFIIEHHFSKLDDNGVLQPLFNNP